MQFIFFNFWKHFIKFLYHKTWKQNQDKDISFLDFEIDELNFHLINNMQRTKCYNTNTIILVE